MAQAKAIEVNPYAVRAPWQRVTQTCFDLCNLWIQLALKGYTRTDLSGERDADRRPGSEEVSQRARGQAELL